MRGPVASILPDLRGSGRCEDANIERCTEVDIEWWSSREFAG